MLEFLLKLKDLGVGCEDGFFREHLLPHAELIYRSAYRLCGNKQDSEDLTQETFYFALKNFPQLKDPAKSKYWLFSILRNLFLKDIERNKNRVEVEFEALIHTLHDNKSIEKDYLKNELKKNVQAILKKLDERLKMPLAMFYFEGKSYKEISDQLDIPIGTVMSRIARAKVYLKRELGRSDLFRSEIEQLSATLGLDPDPKDK